MRSVAVVVLLLGAAGVARDAAAASAADSIRYGAIVTGANRLAMTLTNYGFYGNGFVSRSPSLEFPVGSGFEHLTRSGLWIGARALGDTGEFIGVTSGIGDDTQGSSGQSGTEFTPAGNTIVKLSRIANSPSYSAAAVSDEDLLCSFSDRPARGGNQSERHRPLGIIVRQRALGFSLSVADAFEIVQLVIVNDGPPLRDLYVGVYGQFISGNKNAYSTWPPSATSGPGSWYYKSHIEYDATRRLYKERYCLGLPYPDGCNTAYCPPWAGMKLLGTEPDTIASKTVSFNWWQFTPGDQSRDTDLERYALLSASSSPDPSGCVPGANCSPIALLSVGPFAQIDPGDSIRVDLAFVGGEDETRFLANADYAQFASDVGYRLPEPPPSPRVHVESSSRRADVYWDDSPEFAVDVTSPAPLHRDFEGYRVYFGLDRQHPTRVAQFDLVDTTGFNTGLDSVRLATPKTIDGVTYRYRLSIPQLRDGLNYYGAVTSFDIGDAAQSSLESGTSQNKFQVVPNAGPHERGGGVTVYPNPYRVEAEWDRGARVRDHYLWFANLPLHAVLRIYTLAGDRVFDRRFDGATYHGGGTRGLYDPRQDLDTPPPSLSGGSFAWDLITTAGEAAATGLYLFSVEDLDTGAVSRGRFLVVKSDREN